MPVNKNQTAKNVMEWLVSEEIERRLKLLLPKIAEDINWVEVATYALNHLPPLYACSEQGWNYQQQRGREELSEQIRHAVSQAITVVQRDPIRLSTPLIEE
ncbi:MAG TPA: late competence development ComFB family protein [Leptolyngbyaceae cyanobacterium]|jgi:hypothetical protein